MPFVDDAINAALAEQEEFHNSIDEVREIETVVARGVDPQTGQTLLPINTAQENFRQAEITAQKLAANAGSIRELNGISNGESATESHSAAEATDLRIHLKAQTGAETQVYGPMGDNLNVLRILHDTQGILFPYTPSIEWAQTVEYAATSLTHSNQDYYNYKNTPSATLRVMGEFTVQNYREAQYMIAVIHFLRTASKMFFGKKSENYPAGMPPPVLIFSGYGNYMFNDLPVIVRNHSYSLPKDVDYIDVTVAGGKVRLPAMLTLSLELAVQNTPKKHREEFNLNKFRTGELMRKNKGWI